MRITNQMINESARKAGLPIHYNSLLNHINKNSGNSLLDSLTKTNSSTNLSDVTNGINVNSTNIIKRNQYQKLGQVADKLMQNAEDFVGNGTSSIFAEAENSGNYEKVYQNTEKLTENYNAVIKALKSASTPLNDYYKQMLQEVITDEKDTLNTIGITLSKDGTMHLDKETLKTA
ncbi:MAG: hypothetical protein IKJ01_04375, partial [Lachnospiraceae bacterium]|nr:hypothetical protein [Lachnospiraceae bacterium]